MDVRGDFIIVGSGIAGLRAAVELAPAGDIIIITKADPSESNTEYAQGGIAAAIGPDDSPELHARDTIVAGDGLCDERAVRVLVRGRAALYARAHRVGRRVRSRRTRGARPSHRKALTACGACCTPRDATGREIGRVLWERVSSTTRIRVLQNTLAVGAIVEDGRCVGVRFIDDAWRAGRGPRPGDVARDRRRGPGLRADDQSRGGDRRWHRAGVSGRCARSPTWSSSSSIRRCSTSKARRGFCCPRRCAAKARGWSTPTGEPFMTRYHPSGDLAPRDVVSRSIVLESQRTAGPIFLSLRHLDADEVRRRFPMIAATCLKAGFDLARDLIPVGPAAHYLMGGVETDLDGRTSVPGLVCRGRSRVHAGPWREPAGEQLAAGRAGVRRARRRGDDRARSASRDLPPPIESGAVSPSIRPGEARPDPSADEPEIRELMWKSVGLFRDRPGLRRCR